MKFEQPRNCRNCDRAEQLWPRYVEGDAVATCCFLLEICRILFEIYAKLFQYSPFNIVLTFLRSYVRSCESI